MIDMESPLIVRSLTDDEQAALEAGIRSSQGFTVCCCKMLLASTAEQSTMTIARTFRRNDQTVRNAIHDFHRHGLAALDPTGSLWTRGKCGSMRTEEAEKKMTKRIEVARDPAPLRVYGREF